MKPLLLVLPVLAVLLISGCTVPGAATTGNGVTIDAFEADFSNVLSGEPIQLQSKVSNTGSVNARNVLTTIHGISEDEWDIQYPSLDTFDLIAPSPAMGTAGGTKLEIFQMTAPDLPSGLSVTYNPTLRVEYDYRSTTIKSISLLPLAEARRLQQQGKTFSAETVSSTSSPVQFTITTKGPIRVFEENVQFPLEIQISNVGGGTVCLAEGCANEDRWNKLIYRITGPGGQELSGLQLSDECTGERELSLFRGQTNTITCGVVITEQPDQPIQKQIQVESEYSYFIDRSAQITVTGT
jgi:hypothetical protein